MVRLSLAHGNTEDSAYGYVTHAITIGPIRKDYASAYEWGVLALHVNERFDDAEASREDPSAVPGARQPVAPPVRHLHPARARSVPERPGVGRLRLCRLRRRHRSLVGVARQPRPGSVRSRVHPDAALLEKVKMTDFLAAHRVMLNWALALQGRTSGRLSLSDATFDEQRFVADVRRTTRRSS